MTETKEAAVKKVNLFETNPDIIIEEDPTVTPVMVDCLSYVRNKLQEKFTYFFHPFFGNPAIKRWPKTTDCDCLHCCHPFSTVPIPIPRRYDQQKNLYYVYGVFCSINCAKAYILEHEQAISTTRMLYFVQMCRNVFGVREPVKPAPPRIRLKKFTGSLLIHEFRHNFKTISTEVMEAPFIQNSLLLRNWSSESADQNCVILPSDQEQHVLSVPPVPSNNSMVPTSVSAFSPSCSVEPISGSLFSKYLGEKTAEQPANMISEMHQQVRRLKKRKTDPSSHGSRKDNSTVSSSGVTGNLSAFVTFN